MILENFFSILCNFFLFSAILYEKWRERMSLLEIENVSKSFGNKKVLNKVSLKLEKGMIMGLLLVKN